MEEDDPVDSFVKSYNNTNDVKSVLLPSWDVTKDNMQRSVEYTIADYRVEELFNQVFQEAKDRFTHAEIMQRFEAAATFARHYVYEELDSAGQVIELSDNELYALLPDNYSPVSVLDVIQIATVGAAGTGKSVSVKNMQSRNMNIFTTSKANDASRDYTRGMNIINHPECREHETACQTLIKTLNIPFTMSDAQDLLKQFSEKDSEVGERLYKMQEVLIKTAINMPHDKLEKEVRELTIAMFKAMRQLVCLCFTQMKQEFLRFHAYKFRLGGLKPGHKYYQPASCTFKWCVELDEMEIKYAEKAEHKQLLCEDRQKVPALWHDRPLGPNCMMRKNLRETVKSQEAYKRYCLTQMTDRKRPPIMAMQNIMMVEEDGQTPYAFLPQQSIMTVLINMLYNPPHYHEGPACWFSSGSDAQLGAVNALSALSFVTCNDYNCVTRANFFRRNQTSLTGALSEVTRVVPMIVEGGLEMTNSSIETLSFNEKMPREIKDPGHYPSGKRFHGTHKDIHAYMKKMEDSKRATVAVYDLLMVSDKIIDVSSHKPVALKPPTDDNPYGVEEKGLSEIKSHVKAMQNRRKAWFSKIHSIYKNCMGKKWCPYSHSLEIVDRTTHKLHHDAYCFDDLFYQSSTAYSEEHDSNLGLFKEELAKKKKILISSEKIVAKRDKMEEAMEERAADNEEDEKVCEEEMADAMQAEDDKQAKKSKIKKKSGDKTDKKAKKKAKNNPGEIKPPQSPQKLDLVIDIEQQTKDDNENWSRGADGEAVRERPPKRTKVYISMRADEALTREDHIKLRKQCAGIKEYLEVGKQYSEKACKSSRAGDQLGPFKYDVSADMVTIVSSVDFEACEDEGENFKVGELITSALHNEECVQLHMTFKRKRMFASGKEIVKLDNSVRIVPRGVTGTVVEIMKDQTFNNTGAGAGFKLFVYGGIVHEFLFSKASEMFLRVPGTTEGEMELLENYKDKLSTMKPTDETVALYNLCLEYTEAVEVIADRSFDPATLLSTYLDSFRTMITKIINLDPVRADEEVITFYSHQSPFYSSANKLKVHDSVSLELYGEVPLVFLGNNQHEAIEKSKEKVTQKANFEERYFYMRAKNHPVRKIVEWGMKNKAPDVLSSSMIVLRLGKVLIATSEPHDAKINWHDMFGSKAHDYEKTESHLSSAKRRFGLLTKRNMPCKQEGDKHCYHKSFLSSVGDFMCFPDMCMPGQGPKGSDVIIKLSNGRKTTDVLFYDKTKSSTCVSKDEKKQEMKHAVWDDSHVFAFPSPFIMDLAQTCHSAQGKTMSSKVFMDMLSLTSVGKGDKERLIFDEDNTKAAILVWATRADKPQNAQSANSEKMKRLFVKPASVESEQARNRLKCMVRKEHMR